MSQTRPASTPVLQAAPPPLNLAAHERTQAAANDLDILQSELAKFDLGFERADVVQRGGRDDKATNGIMKTAKRKFNIIHFSHPHKSNQIVICPQLFELKGELRTKPKALNTPKLT
jgi:hypothetical protein